jgi:hypothetical protein
MHMKKSLLAMAIGLLATTAYGQQAGGPRATLTTPEGALMESGESLAYKPGQLTQAQLMSSTRDLFRQDSANVFRRFPREATAQMVKFYTEALGLRSLNPIQLTSSQQMLLTSVGTGQIKLAAGQQGSRSYIPGGYKGATGLRILTLTYPDEATVTKRFTGRWYQGGARHRSGRLQYRGGDQARRQGWQQ